MNLPWHLILTETERSEPYRKEAFDFIARISLESENWKVSVFDYFRQQLSREKTLQNIIGAFMFLVLSNLISGTWILFFGSLFCAVQSYAIIQSLAAGRREEEEGNVNTVFIQKLFLLFLFFIVRRLVGQFLLILLTQIANRRTCSLWCWSF